VNDQEITPFLNRLIDDEDTYYFENFYHQTEQGKTSDSEFIAENALYPLPRGAVYFTHGQNEYHALPEIIKEKEYYSAVFHVNDQEITPFLNRLIDDEDTYYFENFYHQTEQGKTSDSEFIAENALYPLPRGAVYFTHGQNEYHALPEIIKEKEYYSAVFHANDKSFWNRDQMYANMKFDHFYDKDAFDVTDDNSVGWGLKDKPFFEQSIEYLKELEEPFYAKFITLTNHFPFELDESDRSIDPYDSNSNTLNHYFPTVRYMD